MQLGMIGLGRMGANMCRRLMRAGHDCVVHDVDAGAIARLTTEGARGAETLGDLIVRLERPRVLWLMVPAAYVEDILISLSPLLEAGDIVVDGGNSHYRDAIRRTQLMAGVGVKFVDVGTSGGIWGLEQGYCLMIGGDAQDVAYLEPIFKTLAPGGNAGASATQGYLRCGSSGAGHFVKMIHNGIEYGLMAAYAEGFNLLRHANAGREQLDLSAETAPLGDAAAYSYDLDLGAIAELWRHGSVVRSWLLDLTAQALASDGELSAYSGHVSDSGEGRWTLQAAVDTAVPVPVLSAALFARFSSRGESAFADKLLSAMRAEFGGHAEQAPKGSSR